MPGQAKAELYEMGTDPQSRTLKVTVQFNPETLRITYGSQIVSPVNSSKASGLIPANTQSDQPGSTSHQHAGPGATRLSVQLMFDVTSVMPLGDEAVSDVRVLTEKVAYFMKERSPGTSDGPAEAPPKVQFCWGTVIFTGVMDSLDENLDLFSTEGVRLRGTGNIG